MPRIITVETHGGALTVSHDPPHGPFFMLFDRGPNGEPVTPAKLLTFLGDVLN